MVLEGVRHLIRINLIEFIVNYTYNMNYSINWSVVNLVMTMV